MATTGFCLFVSRHESDPVGWPLSAVTVLSQGFLGINCASVRPYCDVSIEDISLSPGFPFLTVLFLKSVL